MAVCLVSKHSQRQKAKQAGLSNAYIAKADTALRHTPDAAALVLSGAMSLDAAYKHAHNVKLSAEGEEGVMRTLRAEAPGLADPAPRQEGRSETAMVLRSLALAGFRGRLTLMLGSRKDPRESGLNEWPSPFWPDEPGHAFDGRFDRSACLEG